ncbi:9698_t:CDS:1, partial [Scutellospora calospora]
VKENNNSDWDLDTEINKGKESMNTENTKTDLTLSKEIETKAKTTKKEGLELINKPKPKVSNNSDLLETELTIQIPMKENTEEPLIPKKGVKSIDVPVF